MDEEEKRRSNKRRTKLTIVCVVLIYLVQIALVNAVSGPKTAALGRVISISEKEKRSSSDNTDSTIRKTVIWGAWEQDNNLANGGEGIEWTVLDEDSQGFFLVSNFILDNRPYGDSALWKKSEIREWLNSDFLNDAFSTKGAGKIIEHTTSGTEKDKIFLLSVREVNEYFATDSSRKCHTTAYARSRGAVVTYSTYGTWGLRSLRGGDLHEFVTFSGEISRNGWTTGSSRGIRPAMWLKKDAFTNMTAEDSFAESDSADDVTPVPTKAPEQVTPIPIGTTPSPSSGNRVNKATLVEKESVDSILQRLHPAAVVSASATSTINQSDVNNQPMNAFDQIETTDWQEGEENGPGIGVSLAARFGQQESVSYITLKLGNWKREKNYYDGNNRPKALRIEMDGFDDVIEFPGDRWKEFCLRLDYPCRTSWIKFTIKDVYRGTTWNDTVISDIQMYCK